MGVGIATDNDGAIFLVSAFAGRIPQPGEVIEKEGLRFEILASTDRKVEKVRVSRALTQAPAKEASS